MKFLVAGGAGYSGSHTCKVLAHHGCEPVVYDNLSRGNRWAARYGMFELGDIGDAARVRSVLEKYRPSALMHFAAYAYVSESVANSLLYYRIVGEAASLLQALIGFTPTPVVFSSR
ncbi:NAD-dependent epimerase/dehydratase family protein [Bradyrhizobium lupini]|uniref:NAD-dependent epimerase/dehydratase family protein n=1 Tax=Rhizobium lupini TaxID=136996 RepID=UPI00366FAD79